MRYNITERKKSETTYVAKSDRRTPTQERTIYTTLHGTLQCTRVKSDTACYVPAELGSQSYSCPVKGVPGPHRLTFGVRYGGAITRPRLTCVRGCSTRLLCATVRTSLSDNTSVRYCVRYSPHGKWTVAAQVLGLDRARAVRVCEVLQPYKLSVQ